MELLSQRHGDKAYDGVDEPVVMRKGTPGFVAVSFAQEQAGIVAQGVTSAPIFQRLFLDPYELGGERYHPGPDSTVHGVLLATDRSNVVSVPIWTWKGEDGATRFLCQASDDGRAPAFSAFALSERDLLNDVIEQLRPPRD